MQVLEMVRKTRKTRKSRRVQRGGVWEEKISSEGDKYYYNPNTNVSQWEKPPMFNSNARKKRLTAALQPSPTTESKEVPTPSKYYWLFPSAYVIDYIRSVATDEDTLAAITDFCKIKPKACNLCNQRYKNAENLLFIAIKKNKSKTARYLLSLNEFNVDCLTDESISRTKLRKNILTLLVEDGFCGGDPGIFANVVNNDDVYEKLIELILNNIYIAESKKQLYIAFLNNLNKLRTKNLITEDLFEHKFKIYKINQNRGSEQGGQAAMVLGQALFM